MNATVARHAVRGARVRYGRGSRTALLALALLAAAAPLAWSMAVRPTDGVDRDVLAGMQAQARRADTAQDAIAESRRTAIVRAADRVAPSVVSIHVIRRETVRPRTLFEELFLGPGGSRESQGLGSGFIIEGNGLVLTNEHVVRGASEVIVTLADGRDFRGEVAGLDEVTDIALIRLAEPRPANLPVAPLGRSDDLVTGEWVVAIGNPFGYLLSNPEPTVTAGVVSGVGRNIIPGGGSRGYYLDMIQTDASINPGNSGGALVNALGEVVGVNSSIISETGGSVGLGFAIPIDRAMRIADALRRDGRVRRAWIGAEVRPAAPNAVGRSQRVEIAAVAPGSPAQRAGLRAGAIVESVNDRPVRSPLDWEARWLDSRVDETATIVATVSGARRTFRVSPQDLPSIAAERVTAGSDFTFITLTPAIQAERRFANTDGAVIVGLSDAARNLGLREYDLVIEINRRQIRTAQEAANILRQLSGTNSVVRMSFERQGQYGWVSFRIGR
ncbi:MAG: trypsin-like peptidase domain-containing protein [Gemmatimonadetes bacterium]|nr:trypsin-like peptidase domain-containing protein [Gemmatimonadota bacterium]